MCYQRKPKKYGKSYDYFSRKEKKYIYSWEMWKEKRLIQGIKASYITM